MDEVLEATLIWGSARVKYVTVPFWDRVRVGDLFDVPDELGDREIDFGPRPFVGEKKMVTWGSLTVIVEVAVAEAPPPRERSDGAMFVAMSAALAMHAGVFFAGRALEVPDDGITADRIVEMRGYFPEESEPDSTAAAPKPPREETSFATEGRLSLGAAGPRTAVRAWGGGRVPSSGGGTEHASLRDEAASFGMIGLLAGEATGASSFGGPPVAGHGLTWAEGGGLALSGVGEGGGGRGRGVDVDPNLGLGRSGFGAGGTCDDTCVGSGFGISSGRGHGGGRIGAAHQTRVVSTCDDACAAGTNGRLPPEAIQRVVRANEGRFRMCYENALVRNPSLGGRVVVKFLIGRDGNVAAAREGEDSSFSDADARACIVRAFAGLTFPEPTGGTVNVVYPLLLSSD